MCAEQMYLSCPCRCVVQQLFNAHHNVFAVLLLLECGQELLDLCQQHAPLIVSAHLQQGGTRMPR